MNAVGYMKYIKKKFIEPYCFYKLMEGVFFFFLKDSHKKKKKNHTDQ